MQCSLCSRVEFVNFLVLVAEVLSAWRWLFGLIVEVGMEVKSRSEPRSARDMNYDGPDKNPCASKRPDNHIVAKRQCDKLLSAHACAVMNFFST